MKQAVTTVCSDKLQSALISWR